MKRATRDPSPGTQSFSRRSALRILGGTLGGAALGSTLLLPRCAPPAETAADPGPSEIPVADLPVGGRLLISHGGVPVELRRNEEGVVARSLLCTHFGCVVVWAEEDERYHCPCHEGLFDAGGRPVAGPPSRPLRTFPARISGETIVIEQAVGEVVGNTAGA